VIIDGHTDSNPIHTKEFASNVELSHARAASVLDYLVKETGLDLEQFSAFGWGELRPIASNNTNDGRQANRRVEIQVFKKEFEEETIKEGSVDSSKSINAEIVPAEDTMQSSLTVAGEMGDKFLCMMELAPGKSADLVARTISIVLPHGLSIVNNTLNISDVGLNSKSGDTITVIDTTITRPVKISFTADIAQDAAVSTELKDHVTILRKFSSGPDMEDRMEPIVITLRKK
jgi:hypothetical protein